MASQTNHNASYLFAVDGITVWERLRVIRNFKTMLTQNLALAELSIEEQDYKLEQITGVDKPSEFKRRKIIIMRGESLDAIQKCKDELKFLLSLESELVVRTEPSRVEGKTDAEMYEINYYHEMTCRNVRKALSDVISTGRLSPETIELLWRCPPAVEILAEQGITLKEEIQKFTLTNQNQLEYA